MSMATTQLFMMTRSGRFESSVLIYYRAELFSYRIRIEALDLECGLRVFDTNL
jgi:hypothetical protein